MKLLDKRRKQKVEKLYLKIKEANLELEVIRQGCKHREIERVNYEVRVGRIIEGQVICSICGEVLDNGDFPTPEVK